MATLQLLVFRCVVSVALFGAVFLTTLEWRRINALPDIPANALLFNPYNADTRMARIRELVQAGDEASLTEAGRLAEIGQRVHQRDARFSSVLGGLALDAGDEMRARALFADAKAKMPTERGALRGTVVFALADGDWQTAAENLYLLTIRWPSELGTVLPLFSTIASEPDGLAAITEQFEGRSIARRRLTASLIQQPETQALAARLITEWAPGGIGDLEQAKNGLLRRLLDQNRVSEAVLLDQFGSTSPDDGSGGFVRNGAFQTEPDGSPFDWSFRAKPGVSVTRQSVPAGEFLEELVANAVDRQTTSEARASVMRLSFLDSPVELNTGVQSLVVPPGRYRLTVISRASADHIAPAPVFLEFRCWRMRDPLGTITLSDVGEEWVQREVDVTVPSGDERCLRQLVAVRNPFLAPSWRNRYSGEIDIALVRVTRLPS
ncbi:MAG: hypothetical protein AAFP99_09640 [Pseudomonadota bacterium]